MYSRNSWQDQALAMQTVLYVETDNLGEGEIVYPNSSRNTLAPV